MSVDWKRRIWTRSRSAGSSCRARSTRSRTSIDAMSMSVPSTKVILTCASLAEALADIVSMLLIVPRASSRGRTISRSTSSGEEEG
jgi:hypothetical protein